VRDLLSAVSIADTYPIYASISTSKRSVDRGNLRPPAEAIDLKRVPISRDLEERATNSLGGKLALEGADK